MEILKLNDSMKKNIDANSEAEMKRSKQLVLYAKTKAANIAEEDKITRNYVLIGKLYFEKYGIQSECEFAANCEQISSANATVATNNELLSEIESSGDLGENFTENTALIELISSMYANSTMGRTSAEGELENYAIEVDTAPVTAFFDSSTASED